MTERSPASSFFSRRELLITGGGLLASTCLAGEGLAQVRRYQRTNCTSVAGLRALESYKKAIRAMLALPPSDPRNWYRMALTHTLDCPHGNWWFLPWHRGFLGYFERICRELSGDPSFALTYWDWTALPQIPDVMFDDVLTPTNGAFIASFQEFRARYDTVIASMDCWKPTYDKDGNFDADGPYGQLLARGVRNSQDLWFDIFEDPRGKFFFDIAHARGLTKAAPQLDDNTKKTVQLSTVLDALAPHDFITFGSPKTISHGSLTGFGVLEGQPHNAVHNCVGGMSGAGGFMQANLSPVDPIFWLHHANVDRLWDVWARKQAARKYPILPEGAPTKPGDVIRPKSDYSYWSKEPFLFFVDADGTPAKKTTAGDYAEIGEFDYDYEPGSGEVVVPIPQGPAPQLALRTFPGRITNSSVSATTSAESMIAIPPALLGRASGNESERLFAKVTVAFGNASHAIPLIVTLSSEGGEPAAPDRPGFAGVLQMFGHHGAHGPVTFLVPLGQPVTALRARGTLRPDRALTLSIQQQPMTGAMGAMAMSSDATAQILDVTVETH